VFAMVACVSGIDTRDFDPFFPSFLPCLGLWGFGGRDSSSVIASGYPCTVDTYHTLITLIERKGWEVGGT
jgi:hypothetical protein